jgi:hypothetical protein
MRSAGYAFAWLTRREGARRACTGPYVSAVQQPKHAVTHCLHYPEQAETERYAKPVHDVKRNFDRLEPLHLRRFRNLQVLCHDGV